MPSTLLGTVFTWSKQVFESLSDNSAFKGIWLLCAQRQINIVQVSKGGKPTGSALFVLCFLQVKEKRVTSPNAAELSGYLVPNDPPKCRSEALLGPVRPSRRSTGPQFGTSGGSAASDCSCFPSPWRHPDGHVDTRLRWKILGITRRLIIITFSFVLCGIFYACVQLRGGWSGRLIAAYKLSR